MTLFLQNNSILFFYPSPKFHCGNLVFKEFSLRLYCYVPLTIFHFGNLSLFCFFFGSVNASLLFHLLIIISVYFLAPLIASLFLLPKLCFSTRHDALTDAKKGDEEEKEAWMEVELSNMPSD